jgi:hypothetical protein
LGSTPDTSGAGHAVRAPSVSLPGQRACCQTAREPSVLLHSHARTADRTEVSSRMSCAYPWSVTLTQPSESPGSGDDLLPAWRRAWACREPRTAARARAPRL